MIEIGKLIHNAKFYQENNSKTFAGSSEKSLALVKNVKCSVADITWQNKAANNKNTFDTNLKITTWFFKANINMLVKLDNDEQIYKINYIENVEFKNRILIFTLSKYEGSTNGKSSHHRWNL